MRIIAIITVVTQHINMSFRHILQIQEKLKLGRKLIRKTDARNKWKTHDEAKLKTIGCPDAIPCSTTWSHSDTSSSLHLPHQGTNTLHVTLLVTFCLPIPTYKFSSRTSCLRSNESIAVRSERKIIGSQLHPRYMLVVLL